jgi:hypothetical protein
MAIRLRFTTPAGHGQTNIDCGSVDGGRSGVPSRVSSTPAMMPIALAAPPAVYVRHSDMTRVPLTAVLGVARRSYRGVRLEGTQWIGTMCATLAANLALASKGR